MPFHGSWIVQDHVRSPRRKADPQRQLNLEIKIALSAAEADMQSINVG